MSALIDSTYREVVARLPWDLRQPAHRLLGDLGLAHDPDAGWADVFQLAPSLDLPVFAWPEERACDERTLTAFRRAHHAAIFYSVLVDRMADEQAATTPERERLARHFLAFWQQSLAEADGDEAQARWAVDRGVRALQRGIAIERAALARRSLDLRRYGRGILLKLGWASIASECLLRHRVEAHQLQTFRCAFHLLASALQVVDDAEDHAEDEAVRGVSLPAALGHTPAAFFTAGVLLTSSAATLAAQGRFQRFAEWLCLRTAELDQLRKRHIRPEDNLAGIVIASSLEAVCLSVARRTRGSTAATISSASSM